MKVRATRERGYAHALSMRNHLLIADEPTDRGGTDRGPEPVELLAASLASCTAITIEMYAERKGWDLGAVSVEVDYASRYRRISTPISSSGCAWLRRSARCTAS